MIHSTLNGHCLICDLNYFIDNHLFSFMYSFIILYNSSTVFFWLNELIKVNEREIRLKELFLMLLCMFYIKIGATKGLRNYLKMNNDYQQTLAHMKNIAYFVFWLHPLQGGKHLNYLIRIHFLMVFKEKSLDLGPPFSWTVTVWHMLMNAGWHKKSSHHQNSNNIQSFIWIIAKHRLP